ncbi:MAG: DinB family protein [Candidatus Hinthialibacter antarcticus]|nr:DinB family protein [Candidatus Hinthialibacter antarcticus]
MTWKELLTNEIENAYRCANVLIDIVGDEDLSWKPSQGENWMTTGQLLKHITESCGMCMKGFVTGDWGMPEDFDPSKMSGENMLPPAETMATVESVAAAKQLLAQDKQLAYDMLNSVSEEDIDTRLVTAPWDPTEVKLGLQLLSMINHLVQHKGQLFYYLKLQGKPVNTFQLYGMTLPE